MTAFLGTAFLIGTGQYALTAAHVAAMGRSLPMVLVSVNNDGESYGHEVEAAEAHPTEDVAILRLGSPLWPSWMQLAGTFETQTLSYRSWGYPENVLHEVVTNGLALPRPDLIYTQGYVRRRLSMTVPGLNGTQFFELSDAAGGGCSGAPVLRRTAIAGGFWDVVGVYIGERQVEGRDPIRVGLAVREEAFRDWVPDVLGRSILDESRSGSLPHPA